MSGRRAANRISGPRSALTDFLASHNISAAQIRDSFTQRARIAAEQNAAATEEATSSNDVAEEDEITSAGEDTGSRAASRKRKRKVDGEEKIASDQQDKAKAKAVAKKKKKAKKHQTDSDAESDDDYLDSLGADMYQKSKPLPGQFENCEICNKRFTVTAYSKTGPEGGLVCGPCGKDLIKDDLNVGKKTKKSLSGKARRKVESNRLDGLVKVGPRTLQDLCIAKVADLNQDIEEFGDLPEEVLSKLSEIFSKRRVMDSRTLKLFLRPDLDTVAIHDCAKLEAEDFCQIFAVSPNVEKLILRNACQFKDSVLDYMLERVTRLTHFQVYASNLISNAAWMRFFKQYGHNLDTLKLQWLDAAFTDEVVACMVENCPNLKRLKLKHCPQMNFTSILYLTGLKKLEHLSLDLKHIEFANAESSIRSMISEIGSQLVTLSIENTPGAHAIVEGEGNIKHCKRLKKLRLSDLYSLADADFKNLFSTEPQRSIPSLDFLDLSCARGMDEPEKDAAGNEILEGVASAAFPQIMKHSGRTLKRLNISSCRHISHAAFLDAFATNSPIYPLLEELDLSFCNNVDTSIIKAIFSSCPRMKKLTAFGCFKIEDIPVPGGVALIGVPTAQDEIVKLGDANGIGGFALEEMLGVVGVAA